MDFRDLDSDNDGVPDLNEAGLDPSVSSIPTMMASLTHGPDADMDGIQDLVDPNPTLW